MKTAERHYIHAGMIEAARVMNDIITKIRASAEDKSQESKPCEL